jgi:hypothetical protein
MAQLSEEPASTATVALSAERYRPKIYGFQIHELAKLQRWQEAVRDRLVQTILLTNLFSSFTLEYRTCAHRFFRQVARLVAAENAELH